MARTEECILYRNFDNGEVLDRMTSLMNSYEAGEEGFENRKEEFFHMAGSLVEMAGMYGFSGNLWQDVYKRQEEDSHLGDFIQDDNVPVPARCV